MQTGNVFTLCTFLSLENVKFAKHSQSLQRQRPYDVREEVSAILAAQSFIALAFYIPIIAE